MDPALLIPLIGFVILAALFASVLQRAGRVVAETREAEGFRRRVDDLARRIDTSLGGVLERIDQVRRRKLEADSIAENVTAALDAIRRYEGEAQALRAPGTAIAQHARLIAQLERAARALEMVQHGCAVLGSVRGGHQREVEAQTSIKRGYLNLLHAREAILEHAAEIAEVPPISGPAWFSRRRRA